MGNANKTVTLTVDVQAKMSDLQKQVDNIRKTLGSLELGDKLKESTNQTLNGLLERITKIKDYTKNNRIDLVDEKKVQSELKGIEKDFNAIIGKLTNNTSKIRFGDDKALKAIEKELEAYNKSIKAANKDLEQQVALQKQLKSTLNVKKSEYGIADAETEANNAAAALKKVQDEFKVLKKAKEDYYASKKGNKPEDIDRWWNMKDAADAYLKKEAEVKAAESKHAEALSTLTQAQDNFNNATKDTQEQLKKVTLSIETMKATAGQTANGEFTKLIERLTELGKGGVDFGFDPKEIKSFDELLEKVKGLQNADLDKVREIIKGIIDPAKESAGAMETLRNSVSENTSAFKELDATLERFKQKAAYFFGIDNALRLLKRGLRSAYETVKDLDEVMTQTAVVTEYTVADMWEQLPEYTRRANELGVSIHDVYESATLYYQQGLKTNEVMQLSNETLKMARIANLNAADATSRMTNALRGFNMELNETNAQRVNDVYSKLAAITASDTNEISTAMTKVASLAHNANMEFETTSAFLAQMIETTRESAETAGTALKTVVARFSEVKKLYTQGDLLGTDEEGEEIDVNKVSAALRSAGINLNEYFTGAKGLDDIFIDLAKRWQDLDMVQQRYIATMAAGSRQQSRFLALMSDYKRTTELVTAANTSAGASQEQFEKTLDSFKSKLSKLKNSWDTFLMGIADNQLIKGFITLIDKLVTALNKLFERLDKLPFVLGDVAGIGGRVVTAFAGMKLAGAALDKAISKIGKSLLKSGQTAGEEAGVAMANGISVSMTKSSKNIFSKKFWSNIFSVPKADFAGAGAFEVYKAEMAEANRMKVEAAHDGTLYVAGIQKEKAATAELAATLQIENAELYEQSLVEGKLSVEKLKNNILDQQALVLSKKNSLSLVATIVKQRILNNEEGASAAIKALLIKRTEGSAVATALLGKAQDVASVSAGKLLLRTLALAGGFALLAGGIIAAIKGFQSLWKAIHKNPIKEALKDAEDAAKAADGALNEVKTSYNDLTNSVESLDEKYESIEKMTRGTQAWRDAVQEVNTQVLELMGKYDGLQITNDNGVLKIANIEAFTEELLKQYNSAQIASIAQNQQTNYWKQRMAYNEENWVSGSDKGAEEIINKVARQIATGQLTGTAEEIDKAARAYVEANGYVLKADEDMVQKLTDYGKTLIQNDEKIAQQYKAIASILISESDVKDELVNAATNFIGPTRMDQYKITEYKVLEKLDEDEIKEQLAQSEGYENYQKYIDAVNDGKDITLDAAKAQLALIKAQDKAKGILEKFNHVIESSPLLKSLYGREDLAGLNQNDLDQVKEKYGLDIDAYIKGSDTERADMMSQFERLVTEEYNGNEELQAIYETVNDYIADIGTGAARSYSGQNQAQEKFNKMGFNTPDNLKNASGGALNELADHLYSIFLKKGPAAIEEFQKEFNNIINKVDTEKIDDFIQQLGSSNWDFNGLDQFSDSLKDLEIYEGDVDSFVNKIKELADATTKVDLEKITDQLYDMLGLAEKLKSGKQGRAGLTQEDVDKLVEAGVDSSLFERSIYEDGFVYVGNSIEDLVNALTKFSFKQELEVLNKNIENGNLGRSLNDEIADTRNGYNDADYYKTYLEEYFARGGSGVSEEYYEQIKGMNLTQVSADNGWTPEETRKYQESQYKELWDKIQEDANAITKNTDALEQATMAQETWSNIINSSQIELFNAYNNSTPEGQLQYQRAMQVAAQNAGVPEDQIYGPNALAFGALDTQRRTYEEAQRLEFDPKDISEYAKVLKEINGNMNNVEAAQSALSSARVSRGMKALVDSYDEWTEALYKDGTLIDKLDNDSGKLYIDMKKSVNDLLDTSKELPDEFFKTEQHLEMIRDAVYEGGDALAKLRVEAGQSFKAEMHIDDQGLLDQLGEIEQYILDFPDLEVGSKIDISGVVDGFNEMLKQGKISAEAIQAYFDAIGIDIQFDYGYEEVEIDVPDYKWVQMGNGGMTVAAGTKKQKTKVPTLRTVNSKARAKGPARKTYSSKNSGGSGGSSKSEKTDTWENPYDELYNLTEKINEALRTREALERRYEKLVKKTASTIGEVTKAYYDQIRQLRTEADLQYQMQAGRARQLNNVGNEYYMDDEGNRRTFAQMGVTKYASYNQQTGLLQIDWSGLETLEGDPNKVEEGKAAEAYISRLEELQDQFEEVRDKLWDIEDQIEELREEAIENYLTFEDRVMDALVDSYQRQIDEYSTLSDQIKEQTDAIIKGIQDDVALSRQIRDNTKKEEDIADKEARLAYLRRDTSGANALEIKKLEEEIGNARESYSDTLVDQQLTKLSDDANAAAEQRQHQIEIMQNQLDVAKENGTLWGEVWDLINTATAADGTFSQNTELVTLLEESEAYQSLSKIGQMKWWEEVAEAFKRAQVGLSEAEDKYGVDANGDGKVTSSGTSSAISSTAAMSSTPASAGSAATSTSSSSAVSTAGSGHFAKVGAYEHPMAQMPAKEVSELQQALNAAGFTDNDGKKLAVDGKYGSRTRAAVYKLQQKLGNVRVDGYYGPETRKATLQSQFKAYKTGGLADYTGPAWLDGSKTHPELVLNAKDTENFIELKNILAHSMGTQGAGGINSGDTYYEFNIDAEIGSDYDVEKLADKIKRLIYNDSSYRNVNSISFTR